MCLCGRSENIWTKATGTALFATSIRQECVLYRVSFIVSYMYRDIWDCFLK